MYFNCDRGMHVPCKHCLLSEVLHLDVLHVGGGHLQLKEEQEWSSAVPRGHWALDLKQLSFSLACIPTHQRLRLPMLSVSMSWCNSLNNMIKLGNNYNATQTNDQNSNRSCAKPQSYVAIILYRNSMRVTSTMILVYY